MLVFEDSYKKTFDKWRTMLLRTNLFLVIIVLIVELIMYFVLKRSNLILQPTNVYLMDYLIRPTLLNIAIIGVGHTLSKLLPSDSKLVFFIPSIQLSFCCAVVASTHYTFPVTLGIFCLPLFTTVIFSNSILTWHIGILCSFLLAFVLFFRKLSQDDFSKDIYFWPESIVAFFILFGTIYVCNVLIKFQEEKSDLITQSYAKQLEMQKRLNKDQKTGLYGATIFKNQLEIMTARSERTNEPLALAIIDIDDFKKINDTYGHLKGDNAILKLTEIMKMKCRKNMFMSRFGGEEFAIIFSENETASAIDFCEKLRQQFEDLRYDFMEDVLTVSIGIAFWRPECNSIELFENADAAMYSAKNNGKNKITIYDSSVCMNTAPKCNDSINA